MRYYRHRKERAIGTGDATPIRTIFYAKHQRVSRASSHNLVVARRTTPIGRFPASSKAMNQVMAVTLSYANRKATNACRLSGICAAHSALLRFGDFLYNIERYVLWITDDTLPLAATIPPVAARENAPGPRVRRPQQEARCKHSTSLLLHNASRRRWHRHPRSVIERRQIFTGRFAVGARHRQQSNVVVYGAPASLFAIISSKMVRIWTEVVRGN